MTRETRPDSVICLSLSEWGDVPHNSRHLMNEAAGRGYKVLYVESIGLRAPQLTGRDAGKLARRLRRLLRPLRRAGGSFWVYTPFALPFHGSPLVERLNVTLLSLQLRVVKRALGLENFVFWSYLPQMVTLGCRLGARRTLYFRTDDYTALPGVPVDLVAAAERDAVGRADLCVGVAKRYLDGPLAGARRALWMPNGVELRRFLDSSANGNGHEGISLLMVGTLDSWLAVEMLRDAARLRPGWTITFAGPTRTDLSPLADLPNVRHLGVVPYDEVPNLMAGSSVGLVPFRIGAIAEGATPGKLFQYLAAGRPVVATRAVAPPDDLRPYVRLIDEDADELVSAVEELMSSEASGDPELRRAAVGKHTWSQRFGTIEEALGLEAVS